jgi:hypothetical protein
MKKEYLTRKELAAAMGRSVWYVDQMCRGGFVMPGGLASVCEAREWLRNNPKFNSKHPLEHLAKVSQG